MGFSMVQKFVFSTLYFKPFFRLYTRSHLALFFNVFQGSVAKFWLKQRVLDMQMKVKKG